MSAKSGGRSAVHQELLKRLEITYLREYALGLMLYQAWPRCSALPSASIYFDWKKERGKNEKRGNTFSGALLSDLPDCTVILLFLQFMLDVG